MSGPRDAEGAARLLQTVAWQRLDRPATEICRLWQHPHAYRLEGTVLDLTEGEPAEVAYDVLCDGNWETREARARLARGESVRTVELRREDHDRWWRDGKRVRALDGTKDIDLAFTPATNTLPIRRLVLEVGASAAARAAWVRFPELTTEVLDQRYTRLDAARYRYESADGAFMAELEIDDLGLVTRYGGGWRRVAEWREGSGLQRPSRTAPRGPHPWTRSSGPLPSRAKNQR